MTASILSDSDSEFGYDFSADEELLLLDLACNSPPAPRTQAQAALDSISANAVIDAVPGKTEYIATTRKSLLEDAYGLEACAAPDGDADSQPRALPSPIAVGEDVCYPNLSRALLDIGKDANPPKDKIPDIEDPFDDRSPLQRFRTFPRKPFSVSDLTSGAWCELQYWYTLTRLPGGRRTRTAAMRQGTKVHKKLEDEVHTTVQIDIMSKEDGFGLRLWNLVQGLRTLRDTGLTRELEVWGMVDGNLVNGIIDGVSYENPDPEFEEQLSSQEAQQNRNQSTLTDYFPPKNPAPSANATPKIYLTDVKTRGSTAPVSVAQMRPAKIQLLLYHRFLSDIAAGNLDFLRVMRRYGLSVDDQFSDAFIAQIGSLHDEIFVGSQESGMEESSVDIGVTDVTTSSASYLTPSSSAPGPDLLKYRSLRELLSLVQEEVQLTFPLGSDSLGHMLRVQYVHREDGRQLDVHDFPVARQALDGYLEEYMGWWKGERKAKGVEIEEAFKCSTCEFAGDCSWRQGMDDDRVKKANQRMWSKRKAGT